MKNPEIAIVCEMPRLQAAIDELVALLAGRKLKLELDDGFPGNLREFFVGDGGDPTKLIRVDSDASTDRAGEALVSFEPSDLFLDLLAALRAGELDDYLVEI